MSAKQNQTTPSIIHSKNLNPVRLTCVSGGARKKYNGIKCGHDKRKHREQDDDADRAEKW